MQKVANLLLKDSKLDVDLNNLSKAWDNQNENVLESFCLYNLKDAELTYKIFFKIFPNIIELVKLIGLPISDINRMSTSQLVEWYLIRRIQEFNELIPNRPNFQEQTKRKIKTYKGAFVFQPTPGIYKNIVVFDFRSLYPSIIASHNICPSALNCECCKNTKKVPGTEYWFCKLHKGIIPQIVEELITRRMRIKELLKKSEKEDPLLKARSQNLKLLANAFYGYLGFFAARWYCFECVESITAYGRYYISSVIDAAKQKGFKVIYSDTDSIFISLENKSKEDAFAFANEINQQLPGIMELEFEGFYPKGIFVAVKERESSAGAKKKYALLDEKGNLKITGFETVRRNWSPIAKELQESVLRMILKGNLQKAIELVRKTISALKEGKIPNEKLVIKTQLQKSVSEYASLSPHVAVAKKLQAKQPIGPGSVIRYIIKKGTGLIRERAVLPEELPQGEYDPNYYIEHQIIPAIEKILEVCNIKKEEIISKEQTTLGKFFN